MRTLYILFFCLLSFCVEGQVIIPSITITQPYTDTIFCAGDTFSLSFTKQGIFGTGNIFTAQLSDTSGTFGGPVNIGQLPDSAAGIINCTIPANARSGNSYRIRVVSSSPLDTSADDGINITITATPLLFLVGPDHICKGQSGVLFATGAASYTWSPSATLSASTGDTVTARPDSTTTYTIAGTNNGCSDSVSKTIKVYPLPNSSITIDSPGYFCSGHPIYIRTTTDTSYRYLWQLNGGNITGVGSDPSSLLIQDSGIYTVTVTDTNGCTNTSAPVQVNEFGTPRPVIMKSNSQFCTTTYSSYEWYLNGTAIAGSDTSCMTLSSIGCYTVSVTTTAGCVGISQPLCIEAVTNITGSQIQLYPNPTSDLLHIEVPATMHYRLLNVVGTLIQQGTLHTGNNDLPMQYLPQGMYVLEMSNIDVRVVRKVLKE